MSSIFSSIGSAISKSPLGAIGTGLSGLTQFLGQRKQNQYIDKQLQYQKFLSGLAGDPAKMSSYIAGFEKPLSTGLTKGVENEVQAAGAERGLSTSPQIMDEILAQALGPYQQNEQQMAINAALSSLGLPFSSGIQGIPGTGPMDISALIKQLLKPGSSGPVTINDPGGSVINQPGIVPDEAPPVVPGIWPGFPGSDTGGGGSGGGDIGEIMGLLG